MIAAKPDYIALDSETNGLYPRNGHMIGISVSYNGKDGIYIDTDCFDEDIEQKLGSQKHINQSKKRLELFLIDLKNVVQRIQELYKFFSI